MTARKGVELICAEYQGSNARIASDSSQNEEYDTVDDSSSIRNAIKTEKVRHNPSFF